MVFFINFFRGLDMKKFLIAFTVSLVSLAMATTSQELGRVDPETATLARQLTDIYTVKGRLNQKKLFRAITGDTNEGAWRQQMENFVSSEFGLLPSEENILKNMTKSWGDLLNAVTRLPYSLAIKKPLLWEAIAPDGGRHWIVAIVHRPVNLSALSKDSQLFDVVDKATIFMPEYFGIPALKERADNVKKMGHYDKAKKLERAIEMLERQFDNSLSNYGKRRGKRIVHLDEDIKRVEQEMRSASKMDAIVRQAILKGLSEQEKIKYYLAYSDLTFRSNQAFVDGNLAEMSKVLDEKYSSISVGDYKSNVAAYNVVRNERWVEVIERTCKDNNKCLIYSGYGHLTETEGSLISLLKERGFALQISE